ncbi:MAG: hypothetical protein OXR73_31985, partial [Myxococcales bacterium]|nr:hypothetical protein [Myxococcales bacterium]
ATRDCAGVCNGDAERDCAGECNGDATRDCAGVCNGDAQRDCAGTCNGRARRDCAGVCNGDAERDCAGVCNGDAQRDCAGTCNGAAEFDCAGVCDGDAERDCAGVCNGDAKLDCADVCNGDRVEDAAGGCCPRGRADCNGNSADGCEAVTGSDPNHCGQCGHVCSSDLGKVPSCSGGLCGESATCAENRFDCDGNASNGCEVCCSGTEGNCCATGLYELRVDVCDPGDECRIADADILGGWDQVGTCIDPGCPVGWGDCDGNPNTGRNGCEQELSTETSCGGCNIACPTWQSQVVCIFDNQKNLYRCSR